MKRITYLATILCLTFSAQGYAAEGRANHTGGRFQMDIAGEQSGQLRKIGSPQNAQPITVPDNQTGSPLTDSLPNKNIQVDEAAAEAKKQEKIAKCKADCKKKYKPDNPADKYKSKTNPQWGESIDALDDTPEEKAAKKKTKEQKEKAAAANERQYQSCLALCN